MRKKNLFWLLFLFFAFISCGQGAGDIIEKLGNDYIYRVNGSNRYILTNNTFTKGTIYPQVINHAYNKDFILVLQSPSKGKVKIFLANDILSNYIVLANLRTTKNLTSDEYKRMEGYLLADSSFYRMLSKRLSLNNTSEDIESSKIIADSLIKHNPYYQSIFSRKFNYWIVCHKNDSLYGPLSKEEYLQKRKELVVPKNLKLDSE
jgi:hypothetical protein